MSARQEREAIERRQRIKALLPKQGGITQVEVSKLTGLSETSVRKHMGILIAAGEAVYLRNPYGCFQSGSLPGLYGLPGFEPKFAVHEGSARKLRVSVAGKLADEFYGRRSVPAVQLGFQRDPLITALFGAGRAA